MNGFKIVVAVIIGAGLAILARTVLASLGINW
jgi:hypothetical protein